MDVSTRDLVSTIYTIGGYVLFAVVSALLVYLLLPAKWQFLGEVKKD